MSESLPSHDKQRGIPGPGEPTWYSPDTMLAALDRHHEAFIKGTGKDPEKYSSVYSEAAGYIRYLLTPPTASMPSSIWRTTCWLLERGQAVGHSPTVWFKGDFSHNDWTETAHEARRFATKEEAEQEADRLFGRFIGDGLRRCTATEHIFMDASPVSAIGEWRPIDTAPLGKEIMLWWRPLSPNKAAEAVVLGQISTHETGKWWNSQRGEYQEVWHVTHWMPKPNGPADGGAQT